jgi:hypothetical protein
MIYVINKLLALNYFGPVIVSHVMNKTFIVVENIRFYQQKAAFGWGSNRYGQLGIDVWHSSETIIIEMNDLKTRKNKLWLWS